MALQSPRDKAEQMLRAGFGLDDIVAAIHGDDDLRWSKPASQEALEERRATREWAAGLARELRKAREYADLGRMER